MRATTGHPPRLRLLYVLAGQLRLIVGDDDRVLRVGEIAEFDTDTTHWFGSADDRVAQLLHLTRRDD